MKRLIYLLVLISFSASAQQVDYKQLSATVLDQFQKRNFQAIREQLDSSAKNIYDTAAIARNWNNTILKNGEFVSKISEEVSTSEQFTFVSQRIKFAKNDVILKIVWTKNSKIQGFVFSAFDAKPKYKEPSYFNSAIAEEKKVLLISGQYRLPSLISIPKTSGKHPLVILVHGSGPNDRDETVGPLKPFRDLTYGLNNNGLAVMRYDKRTRLLKVRMKKDMPNYTVNEEVMEDVKQAIEVAKQDSSIDSTQIYICGHSYGGMLLPRIAKENPSIKGLIYLTPNARKMEDVFFEQAELVSKNTTDLQKKNQITESARIQRDQIKALTPSAVNDTTMIFESPASLWYDLSKYDPIASAKTITKPMLFVFCGRDYQVTSVDEKMWRTGLSSIKNASFKVYPKLNHFFVTGEGKSTPAEYLVPGNVDLGMINDMATWLKGIK